MQPSKSPISPGMKLAMRSSRFRGFGSLRTWRLISSTLLLITACLTCATVARASLDPNKPLREFIRQKWTTSQGLPQDSVLSIAQSADGYLWLGTEEGVVRFDGVSFTSFDKHKGLRDNIIRALLVDHQQNVWIGTNATGLWCYKNGKFTDFDSRNGLSSNTVQALYEDNDGALWIGTDGGGLLQRKNGAFRVFTKTDGLADNAVLSITGDNRGTIWIGTRSGVSKIKNGHIENYGAEHGLSGENVPTVLLDHAGNLWIGTSEGLVEVGSDGQENRFSAKQGLLNNSVSRLYEDRAGTLWIGTAGGLERYVDGRFQPYTDKHGGMNFTVFSLLEDREGSLWVGTAGGGVNVLRAGAFTTLTKEDGLVSDSILALYQEDAQNLWIGSEKGLMHMGGGRITAYSTLNGLPDNFVFAMAKDHEGTLWIGTQKGIARIKNGSVTPISEKEGVPPGPAFSILTDSHGTVWIGGRSGLTRFTGNGFVHYTTRDGLSNNSVQSLYEGPDGTLWIGTAGGLNEFRNGRFRSYTTHDGLSSDWIWYIHGASDGTLWLGTSGGGISRFRQGKFRNITTETGLFDDSVLSIVDDRLGNLWMTSDKGVFETTIKQLNDCADGAISRISPIVYGINDGLNSREFNGGFQNSSLRAQDGRLYFPTNAGLAIVDPAHIPKLEARPQTVIEHVIADGKEVDPFKPTIVPPGKGQLEFQFTAPSFVAPDKLQFRYMLEGFDKDWNSAGTRRVAYYTNIPHGEYQFRVRAGINGDWGPVETGVTLTLQPHFYQTFTFDALLVLTGLSLCAGLYRFRVNQLKIREKKLISLVNERTSALQESERQLRRSHDELDLRVRERTMELVNANSALEGEISFRRQTEQQLILAKDAAEAASRAKSDFLANMSHEIRTPINGIVGMADVALSTELNSEQREYLEIVKFSADSLLGIVNDILDFSKIEARKLTLDRTPFDLRISVGELLRSLQIRVRKKGLYLNCHIGENVPRVLVGDPLRLRQVLLNLLDNAAKFTLRGGIEFTVNQKDRSKEKCTLHFSVKDTGIGIPADKQKTIFEAFSQADTSSTRRYGGTGLGLTISYQLATMMGGRLWVESEPDRGSTFHFTARVEVDPQEHEDAVQASHVVTSPGTI